VFVRDLTVFRIIDHNDEGGDLPSTPGSPTTTR